MATSRLPSRREMDEFYDRFVRSLEQEHWGRFAAVAASGQIELRDSLVDALESFDALPDAITFVFKVGDRAVGRIRSPLRPR